MANTPHNWTSGEVITAEKLNNMPFIFRLNADGEQEGDLTNATWTVTTQTSLSDIKAAFDDGRYVIAAFDTGAGMILQVPVASAQEENGDIIIIGSGITSLSGLTTHMTFQLVSSGNSQFVMRVDTGSSSGSSSNFVSPTYIVDVAYSSSMPLNIGESLTNVKNRLNGTYEGNSGVSQDIIYRMSNGSNYSYYRPVDLQSSKCTIKRFLGDLGEEYYDHSGTQLQTYNPK